MIYDLIVIGSGPAGYIAAIRAGQTGLKTLVIDEKYIGGMCLNWGCIPTKSIIESARLLRRAQNLSTFGIEGIDVSKLVYNWDTVKKRTDTIVKKLSKGIEYLWKKNGVEYVKGRAKITGPSKVEVEQQVFEAKKILIATGSKPQYTDLFPQEDIIELEALYTLEALPERPLIFGSGALAVEMAQFFKLIGKQPVLLVNRYPLLSLQDSYLNNQLEKLLKKEKIPMLRLEDVKLEPHTVTSATIVHEYDKVLNCSLRIATIPETPKLELQDGFIKVNEYFQTSIEDIYAVGDVNGLSFLAHSASAQGMAAVNHINGIAEPTDISMHPINIYTDPEIAHIGKSEEQLKAEGIDFKVSEYSFSANGKALIEGNSEGGVRMLHELEYNQVLGVQIVGANATDMISEASILMELEGTIYDVARAIHAHPTISEVFMEAGSAGVSSLKK